MAHGLTQAERWRLKAEEYRAISDGMHDSASSAIMCRLAETYETLAATDSTRRTSLTAQVCRACAQECIEFSKRLTKMETRAAGSCPKAWCKSGGGIALSGGLGRLRQAATAGSPTIGSSLNGAMVSSVM
jgi:hypothetical protein